MQKYSDSCAGHHPDCDITKWMKTRWFKGKFGVISWKTVLQHTYRHTGHFKVDCYLLLGEENRPTTKVLLIYWWYPNSFFIVPPIETWTQKMRLATYKFRKWSLCGKKNKCQEKEELGCSRPHWGRRSFYVLPKDLNIQKEWLISPTYPTTSPQIISK